MCARVNGNQNDAGKKRPETKRGGFFLSEGMPFEIHRDSVTSTVVPRQTPVWNHLESSLSMNPSFNSLTIEKNRADYRSNSLTF